MGFFQRTFAFEFWHNGKHSSIRLSPLVKVTGSLPWSAMFSLPINDNNRSFLLFFLLEWLYNKIFIAVFGE